MNPENKCAKLWDQQVEKLENPLQQIFRMQLMLQQRLAEKGRAINYTGSTFKGNVDDITRQWRNLTLEFAELLERLPFKEWKTYTPEQLAGIGKEELLETWYEYADMFHFFVNIGLALGIDGETLERLYVTKNAENFERQKRGY